MPKFNSQMSKVNGQRSKVEGQGSMVASDLKPQTLDLGPQNLDQLIIGELGQQARWRRLMQDWEQQQRRRRRMRLLPVFSNIASVAALMIVGFFLQAFLPKTNLANQIPTEPLMPHFDQSTIPSDSVASEHISPSGQLTPHE